MASPAGWDLLPGAGGSVEVSKSGTLIGTRSGINFIPGTDISLTVTDDAVNDRVNVTVTSTAAGGGGGGGGLTLIDEVELTSAGPITFTSIPATYTDLLLVGELRSADPDPYDTLRLRVGNGSLDTTANYQHSSSRTGTSNGLAFSNSDTSVFMQQVPGGDADADAFLGFQCRILNYGTTARRKRVVFQSGYQGTDGRWDMYGSGGWKNKTDAIDTVGFLPVDVANLAIGSHVRLYGV